MEDKWHLNLSLFELESREKALVEQLQTYQAKLDELLKTRRAQRRRPKRLPSSGSIDSIPSGSSESVVETFSQYKRVVCVSVRLPAMDTEASGYCLFQTGLVRGLIDLPAMNDLPFVFVGCLANHSSTASSAEKRRIYGEQQCYPVHVPDETSKHYLSFSEQVLWNVLHYNFSDLLENNGFEWHQGWESYTNVNMQFAETICEIFEDGDLIWIHDYYLMLLPQMLRSRLWYAKIGIFLYTPFPSFEVFRAFPWRTELLWGLLGTETIPKGIQVRTANGNGYLCEIGIYPYGIDVACFKSLANKNTVKTRMRQLKQQFSGKQIIVGLDRLDDQFAGIVQKLLAFYELLERNRKWHHRVVFLEVAVASGRPSSSYRKQTELVNELVGRINSTFGTFTFCPVHFINSPLPPEELCALLSVGDVCVVSSIRDGMSLVSYEWVLCQHEGNHGVLVLSEFSGSALTFSSAQHINPWDTDQVASVIEYSLSMDCEERRLRHTVAYNVVCTHTVKTWSNNFLQDLEQVEDNRFISRPATLLDTTKAMEEYQNSKKKRIFCLDHGGTLAPFQSLAELAGPSPSVVRTIHRLASNPQNVVIILCERDRRTASHWYQIPTFLENSTERYSGISTSSSFGVLDDRMAEDIELGCKMLQPFPVPTSESYSSLLAVEDSASTTISNAGSRIGLACEDGVFIRLAGHEEWQTWNSENDCDRSIPWDSLILPILADFTDRTPGSVIERGEATITWYYQDTDVDFGKWQARELQKHLESTVIQHLPVEIVVGDEHCRWIKIRPLGVSKRIVVEQVLNSIEDDYDFLLCVGDDRSDEEMFEYIRSKEYSGWNTSRVYTCKVGAAFSTQAACRINGHQEVKMRAGKKRFLTYLGIIASINIPATAYVLAVMRRSKNRGGGIYSDGYSYWKSFLPRSVVKSKGLSDTSIGTSSH
eukprot:jgi/Galph1/3758/GphlegSOOS_G2432.1